MRLFFNIPFKFQVKNTLHKYKPKTSWVAYKFTDTNRVEEASLVQSNSHTRGCFFSEKGSLLCENVNLVVTSPAESTIYRWSRETLKHTISKNYVKIVIGVLPFVSTVRRLEVINEITQHFLRRWSVLWLPSFTAPHLKTESVRNHLHDLINSYFYWF